MDADSFIGKQLGHYHIEARVGQGGMGSVYRAWDVHLRRAVALKILNPESGRFGEMRARLLVEARSAASLNHPNIVTIYDIGQYESLDYIALEFVEGHTLDAVIDHKPLPLDQAVKYGMQIADAVGAAHAAGIMHRDLKPSNVMIAGRGRVKVLDFGLAKSDGRSDESEATRTLVALTQSGTAVGTPCYMSPEQAQGKPMDTRSDIFSLGAILYEMFTGTRAFPGDSLAVVMAVLLLVDPPPISSVRPVPPEVEDLIARCLRKDVAGRVQTAEEVSDTLQAFASASGIFNIPSSVGQVVPTASQSQARISSQTGSRISDAVTLPAMAPVSSPARSWRRWVLPAAAIALAAGLAAAWYWWRNAPNPLAGAELFRLTSDPGLTWQPTLSRDGKWIAYASDRGNLAHLQIWVQQVRGGAPIQITSGDAESSQPDFSPDGSQIAFRSERDGGGIYVISALGGDPRLIARQGRGPRFSPDGSQIAYTTVGTSYLGTIFLVNTQGSPQPRPFHPEYRTAAAPIWSPDGRSILFAAKPLTHGTNTQDREWWVAPVAGGDVTSTGGFAAMAKLGFYPRDPAAWLPGDRLLVTATRASADSLWLVNLPRPGRPLPSPTRLTTGTTTDVNPTVSGDTSTNMQMAFASLERHIDIWEAPFDPIRGAPTGPMARLTEGRGTVYEQLTVSDDGSRIAFLSNRSGTDQPWIRDMKTGRLFSVNLPGAIWTPRISADGKSLVWAVIENHVVTRVMRAAIQDDAHFGVPETLCERCGSISGWSPDGRKVAYESGKTNRVGIIELDTGNRYDLLAKQDVDVWFAQFSPDGRWITMNVTPPDGQSQVYIARFDPERRQPIPPQEWIPITNGQTWDDKSRWAPDGNSLYFISERDGFRCIWRQQLDPASKRAKGDPAGVMHFHGARLSLRNMSMGPLGFQVTAKRFIFTQGEITGNVWLLRRPRTD